MAGEKSEKATPKRKQDERKKGNIFQSREVVSAASLIIVFLSVISLTPFVSKVIQESIFNFFSKIPMETNISLDNTRQYFLDSILVFFKSSLPFLIISGLVSIVFTSFQTKLLFTIKNISFKMNRLSLIKGFKKIFSFKGVFELVKSIVKIIVLVYIIYDNIIFNIPNLSRLMNTSIQGGVMLLGEILSNIVYNVASVFIVLSVADYFYQMWEYNKELRMTKQEVKEEYKQMEGDPQIKGKIKDMQRQRANNRMMQNVPNADVIIRNPTHYAVAVKYNPKEDRAPIIIAKGADYIALKIIEIAENNNIQTFENKPLARGLFENVDLDTEIPEEFYKDVAEVLAFIYSINKKDLN